MPVKMIGNNKHTSLLRNSSIYRILRICKIFIIRPGLKNLVTDKTLGACTVNLFTLVISICAQ
jgi:hypothetical protein